MSAEPQIAHRAPQAYAGLPLTVTMDSFSAAIDAGFPELFGTLGEQGIAPAGPPLIRYHVIDMEAANAALQDWAAQQGITLASSPDHRSWPGRVEYYLTDPSAEPDPSQWQTEVAFLIGE